MVCTGKYLRIFPSRASNFDIVEDSPAFPSLGLNGQSPLALETLSVSWQIGSL